jgi:Tfp pilus assembly protein PilX
MVNNKKQQSGFALLVSLIVVGAILSIGLAILDLSIKQVRLAATTKDSEIAFHAANAGLECARFWRRELDAEMIQGNPMAGVACFGSNPTPSPIPETGAAVVTSSSAGDAYVYTYEFTWGTGVQNQRCTSVTTVVAVSDFTGGGVEISNIRALIPGYTSSSLTCAVASQCSAIAVQGYNRSCAQKNGFGTIQREVLLEF